MTVTLLAMVFLGLDRLSRVERGMKNLGVPPARDAPPPRPATTAGAVVAGTGRGGAGSVNVLVIGTDEDTDPQWPHRHHSVGQLRAAHRGAVGVLSIPRDPVWRFPGGRLSPHQRRLRHGRAAAAHAHRRRAAGRGRAPLRNDKFFRV